MAEAGCGIGAVDADLGAADIGRFVGSKEQYQQRGIARRPQPPERDRLARGLTERLAAVAGETGVVDQPGVDRIDPDVPRREFECRRFGQAAQPPLLAV